MKFLLFRREAVPEIPRVSTLLVLGNSSHCSSILRNAEFEKLVFVSMRGERPPEATSAVFDLEYVQTTEEKIKWLKTILMRVKKPVGIVVGDPAFSSLLSLLESSSFTGVKFIVSPANPLPKVRLGKAKKYRNIIIMYREE